MLRSGRLRLKNIFTVVLLVVLQGVCYADINYLRTHEGPLTNARFGVEADYNYFDDRLDFLDISSKIEGSTKPKRANSTFLNLYLPLGNTYLLEFGYEDSNGMVERLVEPKQLETDLKGYRLGVGKSIGSYVGFDWSLFLEGNIREQEPLVIECLEFGGAVLGGNCSEADFRLLDGDVFLTTGESRYFPVLRTQIKETTFNVRLLGSRIFNERFLLTQQLGISGSRIDSAVGSPLLDLESDFILNAKYQDQTLRSLIANIREESPQEDPWDVTKYSYSLGVGFGINPRLTAFADAGFYYVNRSKYVPHATRRDYQSNAVLNFKLWYAINDYLMIKLRARATSHYLLGLDSIAYNRKSNRFFKHPYGDLQIGLVWVL